MGRCTAFGLAKSTNEEKAMRLQAIQNATKYAIEVPFKVMKLAYESLEMIQTMAETGNPNSVTDAGVGALGARSAVIGAFLNVKINAASLDDKSFVKKIKTMSLGTLPTSIHCLRPAYKRRRPSSLPRMMTL